ncbi:putative DNA binding domain-containing protein [Roseibium sp. TrichSKD4]|uniref:helix-turn-helix domain-containing protein n=1 Tax=Roseibium sp. TrichSKD4 TaxID=744980 RepID=UPI0001E56AF7|nr:helix-turn-helix domain-containing protein [Roseibium sp. TrichSKD4]EFO32575.1 putative DNA binding domain-containing protein [Roseibium sp. TrichSKD4]
MAIEIATAEDVGEIKQFMERMEEKVDSLIRAIEAQKKSELPEWFTVKETAKLLRLSEATIRHKVKRGYFDTRRDGKKLLLSRETVLDQSKR